VGEQLGHEGEQLGHVTGIARARALQRHGTENSKQIFQGKELCGYNPNPYINVYVNDLYIPLIGLPILLQENRWAERGST
jgi:hypothetical protein